MATEVVNVRCGIYDIYIGRRFNGKPHFGNPFSHLLRSDLIYVESHDAAVDQYGFWLYGLSHEDVEPQRRLWILSQIPRLKDKRLGCFCKPKYRCHGDVLADLAETQSAWRMPNAM